MAARDSVAEEMPTEDLVVERVFDAPRERVFDVFTQAEHLQKWWGPKMVGISVAEFEARAGGKIFFGERAANGAVVYIAGVVREIEPPSRLVFAIHFANEKRERVSPPAGSGLGTAWDGEIVSNVTFDAVGRRTRVSIRTERSGVTAQWSEGARYGWGEALDKLDHAIADDMRVAPAGEREIVITRTFNAPRARVYEAITNPEHVKNWWGPRQYGAVSATGEFRVGGRYRYAQNGPQGEVAFSGEIRESSPERMVYTEEFEAMPGHGALVTVTLEEHAGKTVMTLRSVYQSKEDRDAVIASGMEWGARLSYLQLDEVIALLGKAA
ncbi:MAG TPA: SRPBCC domain-containing protein [Candidatus Limnocylindrales bacterium]|nr:SRPBCC domain-containing protein [Candidatus Limnocylindrales bacterium]